MRLWLELVGLALLLICSTVLALSSPTLTGRVAKLIRTGSLVLAQSTAIPDRKAESNRSRFELERSRFALNE